MTRIAMVVVALVSVFQAGVSLAFEPMPAPKFVRLTDAQTVTLVRYCYENINQLKREHLEGDSDWAKAGRKEADAKLGRIARQSSYFFGRGPGNTDGPFTDESLMYVLDAALWVHQASGKELPKVFEAKQHRELSLNAFWLLDHYYELLAKQDASSEDEIRRKNHLSDTKENLNDILLKLRINEALTSEDEVQVLEALFVGLNASNWQTPERVSWGNKYRAVSEKVIGYSSKLAERNAAIEKVFEEEPKVATTEESSSE